MAFLRKRRRSRAKRHTIRRVIVLLILLAIVVEASLWWLPLPSLKATADLIATKNAVVSLPWPSYGESAIGAEGYGVLQTHGVDSELPTASVAKIITTLTVLKRYPLSLGQQGPTITLGAADVASYQHYMSVDGSVINVVAGEQLSEYQAIEAMLLPSANNMADSLATWAFGSIPNYLAAANQMLSSLGLTHTIVSDDASGFLPNTKSTAADLVLLGENALQNPVLAQIVSQKQANLPVAGLVTNVNWLLGQDGIVGIKTGNTDQAGGVYLFAVKHPLAANKSVIIVGSIMGAPTLQQALNDSVPLIQAAGYSFQIENIVTAGQIVGYYTAAWNNRVTDVRVLNSIPVVVWQADIPSPKLTLTNIHPPREGSSQVGTISIAQGSNSYTSPVILSRTINGPPWYWRLFRYHRTS